MLFGREIWNINIIFSCLFLLKTRDIVTWTYKYIQNIIVSNASQASTADKKKRKDYSTLGITLTVFAS